MSVKVGIVRHQDSPYTYTSTCFDELTKTNYSTLVLNVEKPYCRRRPGLAVDVLLLLLQQLNPSEIQFVPADGWGRMPSKQGLVDLIADKKVNFSVYQLGFTYQRSQYINYGLKWGLITRLLGDFDSKICLLLLFGILLLLKVVYQIGSSMNFESFFTLFLDTVLTKPDKSFPGLLHSRFVFTLLLLVYLKGGYKAGLIRIFSPQRVFPFSDSREFAEALETDDWILHLRRPFTTNHDMIKKFTYYANLKSALETNPIQYIYNNPREATLSQENSVLFGSFATQVDLMRRNSKTLDCMCDPLAPPVFNLMGGIGIPKNDRRTNELISRKTIRLEEYGFIAFIRKKYHLISGPLIDTQQLLQEGTKKKRFLVKISVYVLKYLFITLVLCHVVAIIICCAERASVDLPVIDALYRVYPPYTEPCLKQKDVECLNPGWDVSLAKNLMATLGYDLRLHYANSTPEATSMVYEGLFNMSVSTLWKLPRELDNPIVPVTSDRIVFLVSKRVSQTANRDLLFSTIAVNVWLILIAVSLFVWLLNKVGSSDSRRSGHNFVVVIWGYFIHIVLNIFVSEVTINLFRPPTTQLFRDFDQLSKLMENGQCRIAQLHTSTSINAAVHGQFLRSNKTRQSLTKTLEKYPMLSYHAYSTLGEAIFDENKCMIGAIFELGVPTCRALFSSTEFDIIVPKETIDVVYGYMAAPNSILANQLRRLVETGFISDAYNRNAERIERKKALEAQRNSSRESVRAWPLGFRDLSQLFQLHTMVSCFACLAVVIEYLTFKAMDT